MMRVIWLWLHELLWQVCRLHLTEFSVDAGTFIAGMLARNYRKRVHTLCLIDPVCFGMFMPHLLHNFLYRVPVLKGYTIHQ